MEADEQGGQEGLGAVHLIELVVRETECGTVLRALVLINPEVPGILQVLRQGVIVEVGLEVLYRARKPGQFRILRGEGQIIDLPLPVLSPKEGEGDGAALKLLLVFRFEPN